MKHYQVRAVIKASLNAETEKEAISIYAKALKRLSEATKDITWDISKSKIKKLYCIP